MLRRIERKLAEVQTWVDSVQSVSDWPAAMALAMLRTRGSGMLARASRNMLGRVWVRPAMLNGLGVGIDPRDRSEFTVYDEVFVDRIYDLGRLAFVPDAIVDCGAYEGYFALLAHARFPGVRLTVFEPHDGNRAHLIANLRRNGVTMEVRPEAVSTIDGSAAFSGAGCGGHISRDEPGTAEVKTVDLAGFIATLASDRLLIKLDIEGEEASVLPALLPVLPRQSAIFFEWHYGQDSLNRMRGLLEGFGLATSITRSSQFAGMTYIDVFAQRH